MNRYTQAALAALLASIAFIGANADAEEIKQPVIKSWEEIAAKYSRYNQLDCYLMNYSDKVCRPKLESDGTYGKECQDMRVYCGVYIPQGKTLDYADAWRFKELEDSLLRDNTGSGTMCSALSPEICVDTSRMFED